MNLEEMRAMKQELGFSNEMLADYSGVPLGTIQKVFSGATKSPRRDTIVAIQNALLKAAQYDKKPFSYDDHVSETLIQEEAAAYGNRRKLPGEFTIRDYLALPDDADMELIDGIFYERGQPSVVHQTIVFALSMQIDACIQAHQMPCLVCPDAGVVLGEDGRTVVRPDIMVTCRGSADIDRMIYGTPEFIIEVLSSANQKNDLVRKLDLYERHGVKEYWIIDPENEQILVYCLKDTLFPRFYTFNDDVPVNISDGKCSISFPAIQNRVSLVRQFNK